jgi:hypothetical protein
MKLLFSCNTGVYAKGGKIKEEEGVDLFENDGKDMPKNVFKILNKYDYAFMDGDYEGLSKARNEIEKIGYTFEFYLDGQAYDLRKIGQKGKISDYAKGGSMADGGMIGQSFRITEMRDYLDKLFPDSFKFSVFPVKQGTNNTPDYDFGGNSIKGLNDEDINREKLCFPQYKTYHSIDFSIHQGAENTYFDFLLISKNADGQYSNEYVGTFGFKDDGNVSSDYITKFLAFLMEQYGLPFQVNHSVMAKGGLMKNLDKIENHIGKEVANSIKKSNKEQLEKRIEDIKKELLFEEKTNGKSNRYYKLKDEEFLILYRLERTDEFEYAKGGKLYEKWYDKTAKYKVGDKVYSYQNKSYLAPISYVKFVPYLGKSEPNVKDSFKYKLKLKDGYSNWINEESLSKKNLSIK